jgi:hypothetical protein
MDTPSSELVNMAGVIRVTLNCDKFVKRLNDGQLIKRETEVFEVRKDVYAALIRRQLQTSRDRLSVSFSRVMQFGMFDP